MSARHENPKHSQGDGAGFGRLRAEQGKRMKFAALIRNLHSSLDAIYIDQVREYAGVQIVFYRRTVETTEQARVAVFIDNTNGGYVLDNDIIVSQFVAQA